MRILLVEDERYLAEAVQHVLKKFGYQVDLAHDGEVGLERALSGAYGIVVLDIMLPKLDGVSVLKRIRATGISVPVLMLSAKGETEDKVAGLDAGADDYLSKPFKTAELCARIRALLRREDKVIKDDVLYYEDIALDINTYELRRDKKSFKLTSKEFGVMEALLKNVGKVSNKNMLFKKVWGSEIYKEDNYVEVYVSFLRKKLAELESEVVIDTVRGVGYQLRKAGV
jgi:Response regulators consisting of a CheY-like receiver domain and a winged-helix DNA-binding domain